MRAAWIALGLALGIAIHQAHAGLDVPVDTSQFVSQDQLAGARAILPGTYTVASLPSAGGAQGKYAYVTDLGGGADMVLSDGSFWKHIRQGLVTDVPGGGSIALTPLTSPPIIRITSSGGLATTNLTIKTDNLYPGCTFRILVPGPLATLATFGVQVAGVSGTLTQLGSTWQDVQWNGTQLVKIAGGSL